MNWQQLEASTTARGAEMNISLEEQIEYMRAEVKYWESRLENASIHCKAILATLEAVKDERNGMVKIRNLAPGKPESGP
jgi:hypothetical protein